MTPNLRTYEICNTHVKYYYLVEHKNHSKRNYSERYAGCTYSRFFVIRWIMARAWYLLGAALVESERLGKTQWGIVV